MIIHKTHAKVVNPYCWKTRNTKGKLSKYSERYKHFNDAINWYLKFGMGLETRFNRTLELVKNVQVEESKTAA